MSSSQTGPTSKANNTNEQDQPHKLTVTESGLFLQHHPTTSCGRRRASQAMQCNAKQAKPAPAVTSSSSASAVHGQWRPHVSSRSHLDRRFLLQQRWCCGCAPHTHTLHVHKHKHLLPLHTWTWSPLFTRCRCVCYSTSAAGSYHLWIHPVSSRTNFDGTRTVSISRSLSHE
jgi:hypothetical protein